MRPNSLVLSVIVPVWRDQAALTECLARLEADPGPLEIIVAAVESEQSLFFEKNQPSRHRRIWNFFPTPSRGGQLASAACAATGDVIIFSHADTHLTAAHLQNLRLQLQQRPEIIAGAFYKNTPQHYPSWAWADPLVRWWMRHYGIIYGDQSPFIRTTHYHTLGGLRPEPIMEDIEWSYRLRQLLHPSQIMLLDPPLLTSMRRFTRGGYLRTRWQNLALITAWRWGLVTTRQIYQWYYRPSSTPPPS